MPVEQPDHNPRVGMFATVRNRRGVVSAVEPFDGETGRLHLVHLEYKDDQYPLEERLLWELEPRKKLLKPTALPDASTDPMPAEDFEALLRAARWTAISPYLDPDQEGPLDRLLTQRSTTLHASWLFRLDCTSWLLCPVCQSCLPYLRH